MAVKLIIAGVVGWMLVCAYCGYRRWLGRAALLLAVALAGNMIWITQGLAAEPLERHAVMAYLAMVIYAGASYVLGWITSRFVRGWRSSRVDRG
ncbi:MAG: hypothetical protein ACSHWZ_06025 [Sulfitobacter sp.]